MEEAETMKEKQVNNTKMKSNLLKDKDVKYAPHIKNFESRSKQLIEEIKTEILSMKNK